jgi:hypothetical protein
VSHFWDTLNKEKYKMNLCPEKFPTYMAHEPETEDAILDTSDWVCLKNAAGCLITFVHWYAADTDIVLSVHEGATGTGTTAITATFPIWVNLNCASTDAAINTMVRQTDAASYTIDTGTNATNMIVQFYIDASILTATYDWIQLGTSAGNAGNYGAAIYQLDGFRYQQETPPNALGL